jgi:gamma-glutamylcyclotransferase (GGCT)/AIG2-like uncharacterized protein YtfP
MTTMSLIDTPVQESFDVRSLRLDLQDPRKKYIFVYGTLKREYNGVPNATFVDLGLLMGYKLYAATQSYPGIVKGVGRVHGEIWDITEHADTIIPYLDQYEGYHEGWHNSLYLRKDAQVISPQGTLTCSIYVYNRRVFDQQYIESGVWEG